MIGSSHAKTLCVGSSATMGHNNASTTAGARARNAVAAPRTIASSRIAPEIVSAVVKTWGCSTDKAQGRHQRVSEIGSAAALVARA